MKMRLPIILAVSLTVLFFVGLFGLLTGFFTTLNADERYFYRPRIDLFQVPSIDTSEPTTSSSLVSSSSSSSSSSTSMPNFCPEPCELEGPTDKDYLLLRTLVTGRLDDIDTLPMYLRNAIILDRQDRGLRDYDYGELLKYIYYEDFRNLILLLSEQSQARHAVWNRFYFIEELTGVHYVDNGYPHRDLDGNLVYLEDLPDWMQYADVEAIDVNLKFLIHALSRGFMNKDPRIRILCVRIVKEMGPLPMVYDALKQYGGLHHGAIETVGTGEYGWYSQDELVLTRRYCYCDLDGIHKPAVPFMQFAELEMKVLRFLMVKHIEVDRDLQAENFKNLNPQEFFTLFQPAAILGYYGIDRAREYTANQEIYPIQPEEYTIPGGANLIPYNRFMQNLSSYKYLAQQVLYGEDLRLEPWFLGDSVLTADDVDYLIELMGGALENRHYSVRVAAADFLRDMYDSDLTDRYQREAIKRKAMYSRILREKLNDKFADERYDLDYQFIDHTFLDSIRDEIQGSRYEWQDYLESEIPTARPPHTRVRRRRGPDGELLPQYREENTEESESNE
jgi:hypothetical protein